MTNKIPPPELTWLYSHCRAIGMECKSDSGLWEHNIALFTINQKDEILRLRAELEAAQDEIRNQEAELKDWTRALAREVELEAEVMALEISLHRCKTLFNILYDNEN